MYILSIQHISLYPHFWCLVTMCGSWDGHPYLQQWSSSRVSVGGSVLRQALLPLTHVDRYRFTLLLWSHRWSKATPAPAGPPPARFVCSSGGKTPTSLAGHPHHWSWRHGGGDRPTWVQLILVGSSYPYFPHFMSIFPVQLSAYTETQLYINYVTSSHIHPRSKPQNSTFFYSSFLVVLVKP